MASNNFLGTGPPMFTGENYHIWEIKMKSYLKALNLWEAVEVGEDPPPLGPDPSMAQIKTHEEMKARKPRALTCIHSALADAIFIRIMASESPKEVWEQLKAEFEGSSRVKAVKVLTLKREFEMLRMKEEETVKEYSSKLLELVNKIRLFGEAVDDAKVVEKIMISLPARFESKISAIEEFCDLKTLSVAELIGKLQAQEQRTNIRDEEVSEGAFQAKQKGKQIMRDFRKSVENKGGRGKGVMVQKEYGRKDKFPLCNICQRTNHLEKDCWYKGKPQIECRFCKRLGHIERNCRIKQNQFQGRHQQKNQSTQQANFTDEQEKETENLFMAIQQTKNSNDQTWFIDSGCTSHMSKEEGMFCRLDKSVKTKVKLGNGHMVQAEGKGSVAVNTKQGTKYIHDVLYIPCLAQNLLSVAQMIAHGYSLSFEGQSCYIYNSHGCLVIKVPMIDKSFPLNWNTVNESANFVNKDESMTWHRRYGHFNIGGLKFMQSSGLTKDLPEIMVSDGVCGSCQLGKMHRHAFPTSSTWRAKEKLELVHTDLCGPMNTESLSQNKYFVLFIDDLTRMTWVYFLRSKGQVFSVFKKFKAMVETQSGCKLKSLRSDNGKEYTSNEFEQFCADMGINHQLTVSYSPQQNGVSERKNRTVVEMSRCMLADKKLPLKFWAEAIHTAVYLLNRLPTRSVKKKTPMEAWSNLKPTAKHLKTFGSICYVHVSSVKRKKLDQKAEVGIFLGYSSMSKGYRTYNLQSEKLCISRDVVIDEDSHWNWSKGIISRDEMFEQQAETKSDSPNLYVSSSGSKTEDTDDSFPDSPTLKTKSLSEIYERCNFVALEPSSFKEASQYEEWRSAMKEEINMIEKNGTWSLVDKPKSRNVIGVKWIFRTKHNPDGSIYKHKARLVVKGYAQLASIDYGDTFAPVARYETIRLILALAGQFKWDVYHLDVKSAFLNGELQEELFVEQPEGFSIHGKEDKVYKLHKALYGLKQAPRAWYSKVDSHLLQCGFVRSGNEATLYVKKSENGDLLIVSIYVDDMLVTGSNTRMISEFKMKMADVFEMSDLGHMTYFLGMEISQSSAGIFISQRKYALDLLKKFKMDRSKAASTPLVQNEKLSKVDKGDKVDPSYYRSLVGSLLYLTSSRPDLMVATSVLSRYMQSPGQVHLRAAKRVLRYVKGTHDFGILYTPNENGYLQGFSDSDWAGCPDDMKSTTGYVFSLGSGVFSWVSRKQDVVAQSTAESEYIAAAAATNQAIWLRKVLADLFQVQSYATIIQVDNKSAIAIAKNPVQHGRTKHINVKFHAIRQAENEGEVKLIHCKSEEQVADIMTKALAAGKYAFFRSKLGVVSKKLKEEC